MKSTAAAAETPVPTRCRWVGSAEVSTNDAMSSSILEIIHLDALDFPNNDRDIYEARLERMLADLVESGAEASESAAPVAATSADVAELTNEGPASDATVVGKVMSGQAGGVRGPVPSIASEAAEEVLGESAVGAELTLVIPSPPTAGVDSAAAEALESSSLWPRRGSTTVDETAPTASPSLADPQEHDALWSVAGATSPEIQEIREGSGAAQLPELEEGDARVFDIAHFSWATAFVVGAPASDDEESAACHTPESETCFGGRVRLVGVPISFEKNFYRLQFTPPLWFA
jgi:hypothetical protein